MNTDSLATSPPPSCQWCGCTLSSFDRQREECGQCGKVHGVIADERPAKAASKPKEIAIDGGVLLDASSVGYRTNSNALKTPLKLRRVVWPRWGVLVAPLGCVVVLDFSPRHATGSWFLIGVVALLAALVVVWIARDWSAVEVTNEALTIRRWNMASFKMDTSTLPVTKVAQVRIREVPARSVDLLVLSQPRVRRRYRPELQCVYEVEVETTESTSETLLTRLGSRDDALLCGLEIERYLNLPARRAEAG